ncbi:unnamed protein product [Linum trigynum]|uniref:Uncharacterized protein n=1 Tax=Linum trigynum TaxID=586398 RepID=A0AAV2EXX4_9ROSI
MIFMNMRVFQDYEPAEEVAGKQGRTSDKKKRSRSDDASFVPIQPRTRQFRETFHESPLQDSDNSDPSKQTAITKFKLNMEENRFYYIPPRVNIKRSGYLQYSRKQDEGVLRYVAHADYYILLRSCARVAQVDIRIMHIGVLNLERRLAWLEKRIDHCLHLTVPSITCDFCRNVTECEYDVADRTTESRTLPLRP